MYSCELTIRTAGLDDGLVSLMQEIAPLPGFGHTFQPFESPADLKPLRNQVVIAGPDFCAARKFSAVDLRAAIGEKAKCVLCAADVSMLTGDELALLDDVWPAPLTPASLNFYFKKLLERLKDEKDFQLCRNMLDQTIDPLPDLIWYKDMKGAHLKVNNAFCEIVGKTKDQIRGRGHYYIWGMSREEYEKGEFVCLETELEVQRRKKTCVFDEQVKGPEGMRHLRTYKSPIFDEDGTMIGTVGVARDVTKELEHQKRMLEMARQDYLTGLATRWYLQDYIEKNRDEKHVTCVYFDLDHFKEVNDTYGHQAGDEALAATAEMMQREFTDGFAARLGGDEFMVVLLGKRGIHDVEGKVNAFLNNLIEYYHGVPFMQKLSISAGIAQTDPASAKSIDQLIHESDRALYCAKNGGRACCRVYAPSMEGCGVDLRECRTAEKGRKKKTGTCDAAMPTDRLEK